MIARFSAKMSFQVLLCLCALVLLFSCMRQPHDAGFTNSLGIKMVRIEPGVFQMGDENGQWDEQPVHQVKISHPFLISETEITVEQFRKFRPDFTGQPSVAPYASGISWHDAAAYCDWLSKKEQKPYRLPTEAEWEYVCRAGTTTPFSSGDKPPGLEAANPWGVRNMHTGVLEWCLDWYGEYQDENRTDPAGRTQGFARVVRGGLPDNKTKTFDYPIDFYARSANRAGLAPGFGGWQKSQEFEKIMPEEEYDQFQPGLIGLTYDDVGSIRPLAQQRILSLDSDELSWPALNDWSALWRGSISAPASGQVRFYAEVDRVLLLTIAGQTIIDISEPGGPASGVFTMKAGQRYPVTVRYAHNGGASYMRLFWSWTAHEKSGIPAAALSSNTQDDFIIGEKFASALSAVKREPSIGFRVVQGPMASTRLEPVEKSFCQQGVKQIKPPLAVSPGRDKPYFKKRWLLPIPPENVDKKAIIASGWGDYFGRHNHDPGFTICPNGDLLVVLYTSTYEDEPEVGMIATRLRHGADEWIRHRRLSIFPMSTTSLPASGTTGARSGSFSEIFISTVLILFNG